MHINRYTIYGYQEEDNFLNIFDDTTSQYFGYGEISSAEKALAPESMTASTTMVATKGVQVFYAPEDDFVPPLEWNLEGVEAPPEFYMREYWKQNPETGEWVYAYWMRHEEAENDDVSNGRMDIYRAYLDQMTMEGHEGMGAILNDGSEAAHAHDIYLQVAYDHGIIIGGLFFLWVAITCIQALIVFMRRRRVDSAAGVVLAVSVTYAVAGVVEWISHPCNPVGCVFLLVVIPMALAGKCKENS